MIMNKFIEFCIKNEIRFNICDVEHYNAEIYKVDGKEIEISLYKYNNDVKQHVKLTDLTDEGLKFEEVCLDFAKDFNDFCEKVCE